MSTEPTDLSRDFTPYGQLVAALLPRAAGLSVFHADGELRWTSDETVDPQLPGLVARSATLALLNDEPGQRAQLRGEEPVYLFWLRDAQRKIIAVLCVRWRSSESDPRTFSYVHGMLRPVIECLRRELHLQGLLAGGAQAGAADHDGEDADLKVLLSTSEDTFGSDIALLLEHVNQHLHGEMTALLMPERNVLVVTKAPGCQIENAVLARAHRHIVSVAQLAKETLLLNEPGSLPGIDDLPLRALVSTVRNAAGRASAVMVLFRKLEAPEFRRREGLLADLLARRAAGVIEARYDALTGLFARHAFEPRVRQLVAEKPAGPWSFLYIDADRLHSINDNHGMQVGDRLLVKLGELIRSRLIPGGAAARISGDRFAILLPAAEADALNIAEGLRAAIAALTPAILGAAPEPKLVSSLSVGVAPFPAAHADPNAVLASAEAACRAAKRHGRNRVELYTPGGDTTLVAQVGSAPPGADADAVRMILEGNKLSLHAQLIAPLPACSAPTPHFEMLLRAQDAEGNPVGPARFLADARSLNLMSAVDRWVVRETLAQLRPRAGLLQGGTVVLAINISGQSLSDEQFAGWLVTQVQTSGIDPQALCFEFCETEVMEHHAAAAELMHDLRALGCRIALDDFGTGDASLDSLRALPLTMLKIDGTFVRDVLKDPRAEAMVQGLTHLARSAGFLSVAEGVETEEVRVRLAGMGVDFAQGFAVGRPVPLADALRDLPTFASVARQREGGDIELGDEDDTVSAALQEELQRELLARGLPPMQEDEDFEAVMERLFAANTEALAGGAAAAPEGAAPAAGAGAGAQPGGGPAEGDAGGDALYPHRAAG